MTHWRGSCRAVGVADETFIGGKVRSRHKVDQNKPRPYGNADTDKTSG